LLPPRNQQLAGRKSQAKNAEICSDPPNPRFDRAKKIIGRPKKTIETAKKIIDEPKKTIDGPKKITGGATKTIDGATRIIDGAEISSKMLEVALSEQIEPRGVVNRPHADLLRACLAVRSIVLVPRRSPAVLMSSSMRGQ
jgi:hypothetical protein